MSGPEGGYMIEQTSQRCGHCESGPSVDFNLEKTTDKKYKNRADDYGQHKVTQPELKIVQTPASIYGYYEGTSQNAKGENFEFSGKYVIVWKKIKGEWKIYLDIWNRID